MHNFPVIHEANYLGVKYIYISIDYSARSKTLKITVDIPKELMDEAMELTAAQTKSQLIQEALVAQIARIKKDAC